MPSRNDTNPKESPLDAALDVTRGLAEWAVVLGDGLELVESLPDRSIDAVLVDPPYCSGSVSEASRTAAKGQGLRSESLRRFGWFQGDNMTTAGLVWTLRTLASLSSEALRESGSLLCFMDWRMVPALVPAIESAGLRYQGLVVWDKRSMGLGAGFRAQHELVAHFTNGAPKYHDKATGNVLQAPRPSKVARLHQTQKPVSLLRALVRVVTPPGGVVVDPMAGSGSTGEAALLEGRRVILCERIAKYAETARKRLASLPPRGLGRS